MSNEGKRQLGMAAVTLLVFVVLHFTHIIPNDLTPLGRWAGLTSALLLWGGVMLLLVA